MSETVTGYTVEGKSGEKNHISVQVAEKLGIERDGRRVKEVTTSQYRHGNGGGGCMFTGFDTLHPLSGKVINGEIPRARVKEAERPEGLGPYADAFNVSDVCGVTSITATDTERVEIAPGVVKSQPTEHSRDVLHVKLKRNDGDRESDGKMIVELLEKAGFDAEYVRDVHGDEFYDAVRAALFLE